MIWKCFAAEWWEPIWHFLYPNCQFHIKPKSLPSVLTHLSYMRIAYPAFSGQLQALLAIETLNVKMKTLLKDLHFMCEFAIPVVVHLARHLFACLHLQL